MSRYTQQPLDFAKLKTVSLEERGGKVKVADFAAPYRPGSGIAVRVTLAPLAKRLPRGLFVTAPKPSATTVSAY